MSKDKKKEKRDRQALRNRAVAASAQAVKEYKNVFVELAKYDKK